MSIYAIKNRKGDLQDSDSDTPEDQKFTAEEIDKYRLGGFETVEVDDR